MAVSSEYHVNITISTKDQSSQATKKAVGSWTELKSALSLAQGAFSTIIQVAQKAYAVISEGAAFDRAKTAINNLAMSYGESGTAIVKAIQEASNYTIDQMTAMSAANKAMLLGVAQSPEEFERLARYATQLGRAMGKDAASSIDDFVVAAGRQSKMIADNLGLMVGAEDAYKRYAEANNISVDAMDDAAKKRAFLTEMLRQAEEKTNRLGDVTLDSAAKLEQAGSAWSDMRSNTTSLATAWAEATGTLDRWRNSLGAWAGIFQIVTDLIKGNTNATQQAITGYNGYRAVIEDTVQVVPKLTFETRQYLDTLAETETIDDASWAITNFAEANKKAMAEAAQAAKEYNLAVGEFALKAGMQWKSYWDSVDQQAEDFDVRREQLEQQHQEKLEELQKRGQSKAIKVDEEAELQKLAVLQERLEIAFQQQAEFTDKTHESTKMAKDLQIRTLQGQIADQQSLLEDYYAGRLRTTGENVNALIAEENRRHEEAVAGLQEEIDKEKELQKQQLGTLMLDTFETWAEIEDIPAGAMLNMRTAIAKEYGLISEEEATLIELSIQSWTNWKNSAYENTEAVISQLNKTITSVHLLQQALAGLGPAMSGGYYPESATGFMPGVPATTSNTTYNFNQTVNTQATTANVIRDWDTAKALVP